MAYGSWGWFPMPWKRRDLEEKAYLSKAGLEAHSKRLPTHSKKRSQKEQKEVYERLSLLLSTHIGLSPAAPGSALGYCLLGTFSTYGSQRHPHSIIDRNNQAR
ncbi:unnamed protein product [Dovyalis caffra]|uniref:Uncharacterized protein n=1 Tax=Dovyalis caffra TaxID=77055 RepID=A0AAV1QW81_9ROSI|nr:unnamed protein product [Dovyalis caffra]